jgi:hypothetical protein
MVCKKNTGDLYWFGPKNALRLVREESYVLSCTEVLVVGVTSESERGRGSQVSRREWSARVRATFLDPSQGPGESFARVFSCACEGFTTWFFRRCPLEWSLHARFIASRRCRVTRCRCVVLAGEAALGPREALSSGVMVCTVEAWHRYFWHCCYMARHACHC